MKFKSEDWERLPDLFCPHCGAKSVWHESGPGDYYLGEVFCCTSCRVTGNMWNDKGSGDAIDFDALARVIDVTPQKQVGDGRE